MAYQNQIQVSGITPLEVENTSAETSAFSYVITGGTLALPTVYTVTMAGDLNSKASAAGTMTIRAKCAGVTATICADTINDGITNESLLLKIDFNIWPADSTILIGGEAIQDFSVVFTQAGTSQGGFGGAFNPSLDQTIDVTVQFSVADPDNSFEREFYRLTMVQ